MTITPENRARFEHMGLERVRFDMLRGFEGAEIERGAAREQALEWITDQDLKHKFREAWRYRLLAVLTAIAAIGAAIAAWPVIFGS